MTTAEPAGEASVAAADSVDLARVRGVTAWFGDAARDLPWRQNRTGYSGLVSEAMLQQTQVSRVLESYDRFMALFPTVQLLAKADEQTVLAAWRGLGYYRRARNLHAAAQRVVAEFGGEVPREVTALQTLPGVGRYTAGAIASIVFGTAAPIVDGNVSRVIARWDLDDRPPTDSAVVRQTWRRAAELAACAEKPGAFNEGLMELGATVCLPRAARCDICPVAASCAAYEAQRVHEIPPPKPAAKQQLVHHHVVVIRRGTTTLLVQRPSKGLWAGMWQPPSIEGERALTAVEFEEQIGFAVTKLEPAETFPYQTTHRRITFHVFTASTRIRRGTWAGAVDMDRLPMSNAHRRVLDLVR